MSDSLRDLFEKDREAQDFFDSLPMFIQDQIQSRAHSVQTKEELSGLANQAMHDALLLEQYKPMFEDETDSDIDLM